MDLSLALIPCDRSAGEPLPIVSERISVPRALSRRRSSIALMVIQAQGRVRRMSVPSGWAAARATLNRLRSARSKSNVERAADPEIQER